ncbi:MAG: hypothetical protein KDK50_05415 [Chlamydiia bacterium]|nr:hypothetical protein [Chlamydiia bacterium]MCP5492811.1 hypothetical protein [Chlamydiales bacterium]
MEPVNPNQPPSYNQEFNQSVELFAKSFQGYQEAGFDAQKRQYEKVMNESLTIMKQAAGAMVNSHLQNLRNQLSDDLGKYMQHPDASTKAKIQEDINQLRNSSH